MHLLSLMQCPLKGYLTAFIKNTRYDVVLVALISSRLIALNGCNHRKFEMKVFVHRALYSRSQHF